MEQAAQTGRGVSSGDFQEQTHASLDGGSLLWGGFRSQKRHKIKSPSYSETKVEQ